MPDFVYGYGEAVADAVCRPLAFRLLDATLRWRVDAQETIAAFADDLDPRDDARRLRTAIDPATPLLPRMLRDAHALLVKARAVIADAAGLVLCDDRAHARATAALLRTIAGEKPVVVLSDEAGAHARIERFARGGAGAPSWIVAVNMVSEGVDIPRLLIAAYATVKRTDLFFRQAVGRIARRRVEDPEDLVATVFLPGDPTLKACAERVEEQLRQQVSDEVGQSFDVEPPIPRRPGHRATPAQAHRPRPPRGGPMTIAPYLCYEDIETALAFLQRAFGFEETLRYSGAEGYVNHAEMRLGDDVIYLGDPGDDYRNPARLGAATVMIGVDGIEDVDALCERAREAGAEITEEPADQEYGERRFSARDPEGHWWYFSKPIREVAPQEWGATTPG